MWPTTGGMSSYKSQASDNISHINSSACTCIMVFPSGLCNVFRQNGPKQGSFSQVSAFPFAPKLSSRESRAIFAQTQHRPLTAEQEFITIWLG